MMASRERLSYQEWAVRRAMAYGSGLLWGFQFIAARCTSA